MPSKRSSNDLVLFSSQDPQSLVNWLCDRFGLSTILQSVAQYRPSDATAEQAPTKRAYKKRAKKGAAKKGAAKKGAAKKGAGKRGGGKRRGRPAGAEAEKS